MPHLASHVLALAARRIRSDWEARYGLTLVFLETFVEAPWAGTCYAAANWHRIETTQGMGRQAIHHQVTHPSPHHQTEAMVSPSAPAALGVGRIVSQWAHHDLMPTAGMGCLHRASEELSNQRVGRRGRTPPSQRPRRGEPSYASIGGNGTQFSPGPMTIPYDGMGKTPRGHWHHRTIHVAQCEESWHDADGIVHASHWAWISAIPLTEDNILPGVTGSGATGGPLRPNTSSKSGTAIILSMPFPPIGK
ncbi:MAG: DUF4338 domain-containing protein [Firmicutes bacterium]|nr:DUF4338 domain-containing protein [Bacillota bacterium]